MWQLSMAKRGGAEWLPVGMFETVRQAAGRIVEIEGYPMRGIFLQIHVEIDFGSDAEALGYLEHEGRVGIYVLKRIVQ